MAKPTLHDPEIDERAASNGTGHLVAEPAPSGPRLPQKIKQVRLPDEYGDAGMRVELWVNCPSKLVDDALMAAVPEAPTYRDLEERAKTLESREAGGEDVTDQLAEIDEETTRRLNTFRAGVKEAERRRLDALNRIVVRHNGWLDENGDPYPQANTDAFWEAIPTELAQAILVMLRREAAKLPSSMMRTGRR